MNVFLILAATVLGVHLLWILWVIFGALFTRRRPWLAAFHVVSLAYSIVIEVGPWPCPLTSLEQSFQARGGVVPYEEPFLIHYLDLLIYPRVSQTMLVIVAVAVCCFNLGIYLRRLLRR